MHECPNCGQACDCDGDDTWDVNGAEWAYMNCECCDEEHEFNSFDDEDEDYEDDDA